MELWVVLGALYALQCLIWLPPGVVAFVRTLPTSWLQLSGAGWGLLPPLPSGAACVGSRLPLVEHEGRLHVRGASTWLSRGDAREFGLPVDLAVLAEAEVRGRIVYGGSRALVRALTHEHAESIAGMLRALGRAAPEGRAAVVEQAFGKALSLAGYRDAKQRVAQATRWLRLSSDLYAVVLFAALPVASILWDTERVLLLSLPAVAALHLAVLAVLVRAFARLHPGQTGPLVEAALGAAVYPPALLQAGHDLQLRALSGFHPTTVASAELPAAEGRTWLRTEVLRVSASARAETKNALDLEAFESRALWRLAAELGETERTLFAAPQRQDPFSVSYCPACLCEYRRASGACTDCGFDLVGGWVPEGRSEASPAG